MTDGNIAAIIDGINLNHRIKSAHSELIQNTINKNSVVVIRNQIGLPQNSLVEFWRRFGKLQINVRAEANNAEYFGFQIYLKMVNRFAHMMPAVIGILIYIIWKNPVP